MSILLFIGFTYICLDTGFSVSGYFDSTPNTLHNTALYVFLFIFCGLFVLFSVIVGAWVSGMFLRERRPLRECCYQSIVRNSVFQVADVILYSSLLLA